MQAGKKWKKYLAKPEYNIFNRTIHLQKLIETVIQYTPKKGKILEVGCGSGFTSILLSKLGYEVTATDINDDLLAKVIKLKIEFNSNIDVLKMDMLYLRFEDKTFDTVFHQGLLEHFDDETIISALKEQKRIAKCIIFDVPNSKYKLGSWNIGDERLLSITHWKKLIHTAGLKVIDIHGRGYTLLAHILPHGLVRLFDVLFTTSTIFVCKGVNFN